MARKVGDIGGVVLPVAGCLAILSTLDLSKTGDAAMAMATTMYSTRFYKNWVPEDRPQLHRENKIFDLPQANTGWGSFPSSHTSVSFCGASLVHKAYGAKWAIPFYIAASTVGVCRIYIDKHYIHDVIAGAMLGAKVAFSGGKWLDNFDWMPTPIQDGGIISVNFDF